MVDWRFTYWFVQLHASQFALNYEDNYGQTKQLQFRTCIKCFSTLC